MTNSNNLLQSLQGLSLQSAEAELARRSYYQFFLQSWNILEPETELQDNWHIQYLCDVLQREAERIDRKESRTKHLLINIPPRSLKSYIVTVTFNAWVWISYPALRFITASYAGELAVEHAIKTRRLIESTWYQENWGDVFQLTSDQNVKSKFENDKTGFRRATSVGGAVTGQGADFILVDDPLKAKDAYSEVARKTATDWYTKTMFSRLNDLEVGLRVVVMQRLHEEDLSGLLENNPEYEHICIPATDQEDNVSPEELQGHYKSGLFFPGRFTYKVLNEARETLGTLDYTGQYLESPSPEGGTIIQRKWFDWFSELDTEEKHIQVDGAYGKENSDNSAVIVYSVSKSNLYIWQVHGWNKEFPDFVKDFKELADSIPRCKAYFEPKAMGISAVQQLKRSGVNAIEDKVPTESKESRVRAASAAIEAGRVYLYREGIGMEDLIGEAMKFPNGIHDDRIDALAMIINRELSKPKVEVSWI